MAIPHVYTAVKPQDFTLTPFVIHKDYEIARSNLYTGSVAITGSGYKLIEALHFPEKLKLGTSATYPTNSFDGSYKYVIWHSINAMYYKVPYDMFGTFEHSNQNFTRKELSQTASVFSVPQHDFGEGIKPNSVQITSSFYNMADDGWGNIILSTSGSYTWNRAVNLVAEWNFDDIFKHPAAEYYAPYDRYWIVGGTYTYKSNTNNLDYNKSIVKNGFFYKKSGFPLPRSLPGYFIIATDVDIGYMLTPNKPDLNFAKNDDFSIGFDYYFLETSSTGSIIGKRGVVFEEKLGNYTKTNNAGTPIDGYFLTSSYVNKTTNVYPYDFEVSTTTVRFRRSDGVSNVTLEYVANEDKWNQFYVTKSGSLYTMFYNGAAVASQSNSNLDHCINNHAVMFNALNTNFDNFGPGLLANVRIFNAALSSQDVSYLYQNDYNAVSTDKIIGNVFYKQGFMMLTHPDGRYAKDLLDNNFTVKFQSTHTVYQYECLVRIKKGDYNITLNPTAFQNPHSDLLLNSMTGSLEEGALFPYFTEIGLYNPEGDLLVVGKTSQPIQVRSDVDINVLLRWDA